MGTRRFLEYGIFIMLSSTIIILLYLLFEVVSGLFLFLASSNSIAIVQQLITESLAGNIPVAVFLVCVVLFSLGCLLVFFYFLLSFLSRLFPKVKIVDQIDPADLSNFTKKGIIIVIPAFNEAETIDKVIKEVQDYGDRIIVIDDGSTDGTAEIARNLGAEMIIHNRNLGLGQTMKDGINKAVEYNPDIIITIDADGQYEASEIPNLVYLIREKNSDLALGSRFKGKIEEMPLGKKIGNRLMSRAISFILGQRITDGQTGFRAIRGTLARELNLRGEYTYTQEMIIQAKMKKFEIVETPVVFNRRIAGKSRLITSAPDYALKAWLTIFRTYRDYNPIIFFGAVGSVFFIIGLFAFTLNITTFGLVQSTIEAAIFSLLFISVGIQVLLFAFFADMFKQ
ncbi:MAG: glycosyltransferase family 2 protein [Candidatus Odinarchaeota archaeon]